MIDTSKLDNVLDDVLEGGASIEEIENSTRMAVLDRYLTWNGIVGYTEQILDAIDTINEADTTFVDWQTIAEAYPEEFEALRIKYETT